LIGPLTNDFHVRLNCSSQGTPGQLMSVRPRDLITLPSSPPQLSRSQAISYYSQPTTRPSTGYNCESSYAWTRNIGRGSVDAGLLFLDKTFRRPSSSTSICAPTVNMAGSPKPQQEVVEEKLEQTNAETAIEDGEELKRIQTAVDGSTTQYENGQLRLIPTPSRHPDGTCHIHPANGTNCCNMGLGHSVFFLR